MMISVAIFWLSLLGFAAVTLSMPTHYRQLRPEHRPLSHPAQWCFRLVGLFRLIVITFLAWLAVTIFLQPDYTAV